MLVTFHRVHATIIRAECRTRPAGALHMICPDSDLDCDNVGCRRGGCQGRRPKLPLFRAHAVSAAKSLALVEATISEAETVAGMTVRGVRDAHFHQITDALLYC